MVRGPHLTAMNTAALPSTIKPRFSTLVKVNVALVGLWLVAWALVLLIPVPVTAGFHIPLGCLAGVALLILTLVTIVGGRPRVVPIAMLAMIPLFGWVGIRYGLKVSAWTNFQLRRGHYEAKVAELLATADRDEQKRICGDECLMLAKNRVSFHYIHGFLNWHDIVYDPNDEMMETDWMKKKQIDIYFISAEPLAKHWYLAHFGD